jgi:hypothetical protein
VATPVEGTFINARTLAVYHVRLGDLFECFVAGNPPGREKAVMRVAAITRISTPGNIGDEVTFTVLYGFPPIGNTRGRDDISITPYEGE